MKLKLARDQKSSLIGNITFTLDARAELAPQELDAVKRYKLGKTLLYKNYEVEGGKGLLGAASKWAIKMMNIHITVDDLVNGKHIECKDIVEMRAVEEQLKEACETFKAVLETALHFGGEELIEI
jgi:hypothetical protein